MRFYTQISEVQSPPGYLTSWAKYTPFFNWLKLTIKLLFNFSPPFSVSTSICSNTEPMQISLICLNYLVFPVLDKTAYPKKNTKNLLRTNVFHQVKVESFVDLLEAQFPLLLAHLSNHHHSLVWLVLLFWLHLLQILDQQV